MGRLRHPALVLYFLSPVIAELLSGSSPPVEFFNPFSFLLLTAFYGSGALIVRELAHRWGKGWPTILLLGLAYGIIEEGLAVKSFFDPSWIDLGPLGEYGRWAGVNWVWSGGLTLYHAVFSIAIPILLTSLLFPGWVDRPWLSRRTFRLWCGVLALVVLFCNLFLTAYRPPLTHLVLAAAAVLGLVLLARRAPQTLSLRPVARLHRPRVLILQGLIATVALFAALWALPNTAVPPVLTLSLMGVWAVVVATALSRRAGHVAWSRSHALAAASGALLFFILLAPLLQLDPNAPDDRSGMALVALGMLLFLLVLGRRIRKSAHGAATPLAGSSPALEGPGA